MATYSQDPVIRSYKSSPSTRILHDVPDIYIYMAGKLSWWWYLMKIISVLSGFWYEMGVTFPRRLSVMWNLVLFAQTSQPHWKNSHIIIHKTSRLFRNISSAWWVERRTSYTNQLISVLTQPRHGTSVFMTTRDCAGVKWIKQRSPGSQFIHSLDVWIEEYMWPLLWLNTDRAILIDEGKWIWLCNFLWVIRKEKGVRPNNQPWFLFRCVSARKRNCSSLAMELRLSCIHRSVCFPLYGLGVKTHSCLDGNFAVPGGTAGCYYDNLRCHQWR